ALLPGVPGESNETVFTQVLDQLLALAVRQRVHWIDDDGSRARLRGQSPFAKHWVNDRKDGKQPFPRARPRSDNETFPTRRECKRLFLMRVQVHGESGGSLRQELTVYGKFPHRSAKFVARVDLNEWIGPVTPALVLALDATTQIIG